MIRQANSRDLTAIAKVHIACFPNSFSTTLGQKLLEKFYQEYLLEAPELFLVAEDDAGKIVGFCMGYYCESNQYMKRFVKKNLLQFALRFAGSLLTANPVAWKKIKDMLFHKEVFTVVDSRFEAFVPEQVGDLLSICVMSDCRGNGMAKEMVDSYLDILRNAGRKLCLLSVKTDNSRAVRFYENKGFQLYRQAGSEKRTYAKEL